VRAYNKETFSKKLQPIHVFSWTAFFVLFRREKKSSRSNEIFTLRNENSTQQRNSSLLVMKNNQVITPLPSPLQMRGRQPNSGRLSSTDSTLPPSSGRLSSTDATLPRRYR
jgi:hypothetical protein